LFAAGSPFGSDVNYRIEKPFELRTVEGDGLRPIMSAVLENGSQIPAVFLKEDSSGPLAAILFDPDESGWAKDAFFPVLFAEFFDYVLETGEGQWRILKTGGTFNAGSPIKDGKIIDAGGASRAVSPSAEGIFQADFAGGIELDTESGRKILGASVLDAAESDTSAVPQSSGKAAMREMKRAGEEPKELRRFFLIAAVALILLYWLFSQSRISAKEKDKT